MEEFRMTWHSTSTRAYNTNHICRVVGRSGDVDESSIKCTLEDRAKAVNVYDGPGCGPAVSDHSFGVLPICDGRVSGRERADPSVFVLIKTTVVDNLGVDPCPKRSLPG